MKKWLINIGHFIEELLGAKNMELVLSISFGLLFIITGIFYGYMTKGDK